MLSEMQSVSSPRRIMGRCARSNVLSAGELCEKEPKDLITKPRLLNATRAAADCQRSNRDCREILREEAARRGRDMADLLVVLHRKIRDRAEGLIDAIDNPLVALSPRPRADLRQRQGQPASISVLARVIRSRGLSETANFER